MESHPGESQIVLPRLLAQGRRFDLAIVDGNHRFDAVFVDPYYLGWLLRAAGSCSSTTASCPASHPPPQFFTANLGRDAEQTSSAGDRHHWAVLRTGTGRNTRPFDYLADF